MKPAGAGTRLSDTNGKALACREMRVMDRAGNEVPAGQDGELWIAGPMIVPGYWRNDDANVGSFAGGFWKSGDIGSIDGDGYVRIADWKKDMISRGGYKILPADAENFVL